MTAMNRKQRPRRPQLSLAMIGLMLSALVAPVAMSADPNLSKPVLQQNNFTFLGSFTLPTNTGAPDNWDTAYSNGGLAYRYVNGNLQFFTTAHAYSGGVVYEFNYPGVSTDPNNIPQAVVVKDWGLIYNANWSLDGSSFTSRKCLWPSTNAPAGEAQNSDANAQSGTLTAADMSQLGCPGGDVNGLYFDQATNRLYWNYGWWYNAANPMNPSFGYSVLNNDGTFNAYGPWSINGRPEKFDRGGMMQIPQWFATDYTGGKTLGVGWGGYFSIIGSGSLGPSLAAINPPDPTANPPLSAVSGIAMLGYPTNQPSKGRRDAGIFSGTAYFPLVDILDGTDTVPNGSSIGTWQGAAAFPTGNGASFLIPLV